MINKFPNRLLVRYFKSVRLICTGRRSVRQLSMSSFAKMCGPHDGH